MMNNEDCLKTEFDCAVCLQKCNHPTQLPCGHIFCFLCVKGIAFQSKKCAMCRADIPPNYLDNPILLGKITSDQVDTSPAQEVYQWFYEGRNGWWKYDERSNSELEAAFNAGDPHCVLLLAGTLYSIDFQSMTQVRRSDQTRRRRVRRDAPTFPSKGIAGIKTEDQQSNQQQIKTDHDDSSEVIHISIVEEVIEISDDEAVIEQVSSDIEEMSDRISNVNLQDSSPS